MDEREGIYTMYICKLWRERKKKKNVYDLFDEEMGEVRILEMKLLQVKLYLIFISVYKSVCGAKREALGCGVKKSFYFWTI